MKRKMSINDKYFKNIIVDIQNSCLDYEHEENLTILYPLLLRIYPISTEIEKLFALDIINQCLLWSRLGYHFHTEISMSDLYRLRCVIWYMSWFLYLFVVQIIDFVDNFSPLLLLNRLQDD